MTNGGPGTSSRVIAFTMYQESFPGGLFGKGAAVAVVMLLIMIPIMLYNIRRFRSGERSSEHDARRLAGPRHRQRPRRSAAGSSRP